MVRFQWHWSSIHFFGFGIATKIWYIIYEFSALRINWKSHRNAKNWKHGYWMFGRKKYFGICGFVEILLLNAIEHSGTFHLYSRPRKTTISHTNPAFNTLFLIFIWWKSFEDWWRAVNVKRANEFIKYEQRGHQIVHTMRHIRRGLKIAYQNMIEWHRSQHVRYISGQIWKRNQTAVRWWHCFSVEWSLMISLETLPESVQSGWMGELVMYMWANKIRNLEKCRFD